MCDIKIRLRDLPGELLDDLLVKFKYRKANRKASGRRKMATYKVHGVRAHRNGQEVTLIPASEVLRGVLEDQIYGLPLMERIHRRIEWRKTVETLAKERDKLREEKSREWEKLTDELLEIINRPQVEDQPSNVVAFPLKKRAEVPATSSTIVEQ